MLLVDGLGPASITGTEERAGRISLDGGLPNPFRTETSVQFRLEAGGGTFTRPVRTLR